MKRYWDKALKRGLAGEFKADSGCEFDNSPLERVLLNGLTQN